MEGRRKRRREKERRIRKKEEGKGRGIGLLGKKETQPNWLEWGNQPASSSS